MKQVLRATAVLSGSTMVTVAAGLVTAKVNAIALGPAGMGLYGLLLSLLGLAGMVAGFGIGTGLVRSGAQSIRQAHEHETAALWSGTWTIYWLVALPTAGLMILFRTPIAATATGSPENARDVAFVAVALMFSVAAGLHVALLNAHHRVGVLARYAIYAATTQAIVTISFVTMLGRSGVPLAILTSQAVAWSLARAMALRHTGRRRPASPADAVRAALSLLRFGGPYTLSQLSGSGARLLIPLLVVRLFDESHVGYVRAASTIAVTYMGFLTNAMSQDYYPRLSALVEQRQRLVEVVNQQLDAVYMIALPLIFLAMGFSPVLVPLIYSPEFAPAVGVLEWQLVGDVFRFTSWTLAFIILAMGRSSAFFLTETAAGAILVGGTYLGMRAMGLEGVGVGYAITYAVYSAIVYQVVHSISGFRFSSRNARTLFLACTGVLATKSVLLVAPLPWAYALPVMIGAVLAVRSGLKAKHAWFAGSDGD